MPVNSSSTVVQPSKAMAGETYKLLQDSLEQLISFISKGEEERTAHQAGRCLPTESTSLVHPLSSNPETLRSRLASSLAISEDGVGTDGFQSTLKDILRYSVNTFSPGFMDKLYAAPLPPGIAAELVLAILNTNLHVYQVSPVLTTIEKVVTKQLARMFGLRTPRAGGISVTGGSASNLTSIVAARNSLFPETKVYGNAAEGRQLVMFTSAHGHYSVEKAAQGLGFGSSAVISVPTDDNGKMRPEDLERLIVDAKVQGKTPFYVNATAGTTVLGSFDPFEEIAKITKKHRCWFHVDGAWGGSFVFSQREDFRAKMEGIHMADSIGINPHKMLGVPLTCSILLARDLRLFENAMTLKASYLFHEPEEDGDVEALNVIDDETRGTHSSLDGSSPYDLRDEADSEWSEPNDLADMTLQCGRRGDSLKLFMSWKYYGTSGYAKMIENAYDIAVLMNNLVDSNDNLTLVLGPGSKPSCLQVCFYYTPGGKFVFGLKDDTGRTIRHPTAKSTEEIGKQNTRVTSRISQALIARGFMIDFAPALEGQEDKGSFLRVVVNVSTARETADRLVGDVLDVGHVVVKQLQDRFA